MKIYIKSTTYSYNGSVEDKFGNVLIRDGSFYTQAKSKAKARANFLSQAKYLLRLEQSAYLKLSDPDAIEEEVDMNDTEVIDDGRSYCPECGTELTDGGYCPRCYSEGDETYYGE